MNLLIKVCGLTNPQNAADVATLGADLMGFIFHPFSPRYVGENPDEALFRNLPGNIGKTGVFVDADPEYIIQQSTKAHFRFVQLHGNESPELCRKLNSCGLQVIKAFSIHPSFRFDQLKAYVPHCRFFLFDTATSMYGGSGIKFNWDILESYEGPVGFFLSGGIGPDDAREVAEFSHPYLAGVDVNSRFETTPGIKNIVTLKKFIDTIRKIRYEI